MAVTLPNIALPTAYRDSVAQLDSEHEPLTVSISDIHGYLDTARSALLTLSDHPDYDPIVTEDSTGELQWAHNDYVLVFNGDLVDRGPDNDAVLELVGRLAMQAPIGRVRVTLGNHEGMILTPDVFGFSQWYSTNVSEELRQQYLQWIINGFVVAAYEGYGVRYVHAGSSDSYVVEEVNDALVAAADRLLESLGTLADQTTQSRVLTETPRVLGTGDSHLKYPPAGLIWLDFEFLSPDGPPQVVGHTRHDEPSSKGNVHCQNVLRNTRETPGGEAVFVESPNRLVALRRDSDGGVTEMDLE